MLQIIPIPAFEDNYIWLMYAKETLIKSKLPPPQTGEGEKSGIYPSPQPSPTRGEGVNQCFPKGQDANHAYQSALVVDPGDAKPVLAALQQFNLDLKIILITHHHHDHIGGVATLQAAYPDVVVYAPKLGSYDFKHVPVDASNTINFNELNCRFSVIDVSGHTLDHLAYFCEFAGNHLLFCGDTLFGAGCGRIFEGTATQMYDALQKLAALPMDTKVYCAHEYTKQNIDFALMLEPNNLALVARKTETQKARNLKIASLPSTIALELATNPYLRCESQEIRSSLNLQNASNLQVFSTIRTLKNHY